MTCYQLLTKRFHRLKSRLQKNRKGVALFIVLAAMATLSIFVGEITYTAQINQKLAYDRLDQIKATSLAKSGLRIALLRIRAYSELKKTVDTMAKSAGASAADVSGVVPKAVMEKIWSEPVTIPFSGDISGLPSSARTALTQFRKESGMEGKLYISIEAQSAKFNINSTIAAFAPPPASPTPGASPSPGASPAASGTPAAYSTDQARQLLIQQLKDTFQKKFDEDDHFRDQYRSFKLEDLADEILGWSDVSYNSNRAQYSTIPFKMAPFYNISEMHYLPSMDDTIYDLLSPQFTAGVTSTINVNVITDAVLAALVPAMTVDERKKFFDFREGKSDDTTTTKAVDNGVDNSFKTPDDFYKYLQDKVAGLNTAQKIQDYKNNLAQRGITLITDEQNFLIHIEATVQQTKRTLECAVSLLPSTAAPPTGDSSFTGASPTPVPNPGQPVPAPIPGGPLLPTERSNLKVTQLRFL